MSTSIPRRKAPIFVWMNSKDLLIQAPLRYGNSALSAPKKSTLFSCLLPTESGALNLQILAPSPGVRRPKTHPESQPAKPFVSHVFPDSSVSFRNTPACPHTGGCSPASSSCSAFAQASPGRFSAFGAPPPPRRG